MRPSRTQNIGASQRNELLRPQLIFAVPSLELKYNKFYIGLLKDGQPFDFIAMQPRKSTINLELKLPSVEEIDQKIDSAGLETLEYNSRWGQYRLSTEGGYFGQAPGSEGPHRCRL